MRTVHFHDTQSPARVRERTIAGLRAGRLPARLLYDSPAQTARYLAYHRAWSPSARGLAALYDEAYRAGIRAAPAGFEWVGLGAGAGVKDARFLALAGPRPALISDTSPSLLLEALERVPTARALCVDLTERPERDLFAGEAPVVFGAFGLLPNLGHETLLPYLASLLREEDLLLLSANLSPARMATELILPQYDNREARAWYAGALAELGVDAPVEVTGRALSDDGSIWQVEVTARLPGPLSVWDATVEVDRVELFRSERFTPEALPDLFDRFGLTTAHADVDASREEGVYLLRRRR